MAVTVPSMNHKIQSLSTALVLQPGKQWLTKFKLFIFLNEFFFYQKSGLQCEINPCDTGNFCYNQGVCNVTKGDQNAPGCDCKNGPGYSNYLLTKITDLICS